MNTGEQTEDADVECMRRLKGGDDLALNEIMERWRQKIANYMMRCVGNEADAVDLAQETFIRVYESRMRYEPRAAFSTWLFHIATNLARSHIRWHARHPVVPLGGVNGQDGEGEDAPDLSSSGLPASDASIKREQAAAVRDGIQRLGPDFRSILLLFEFEELSYQQIAEILGCSAKAVESRLYRARQALREELQKLKSHFL
ncbi:MAG: sigma-70 family RNA polymerase sigma factor [Methylacidiphilales bacterium]|nr:sigma-70 family RNA polymerase sigma factor [Candidatus Methylacidiphilales bacterium]